MTTRSRDERGAVALLVALCLPLLLTVAGLSIDLGMQRVVRRDLQAVADMVALDLSQLVDGRSAAAIIAGDATHDSLATATSRSLARNASAMGGTPTLDVALVKRDAAGLVPVTGTPPAPQRLTSASDIPDAVWVQASGSIGFAFVPGRGGARRSAVGASQSSACFQLGSFAAGLTAANISVLDRYLGDALKVTGVGYEGLADSTIKVGDLSAVLGVGSTTALVDVTQLSLGTFFAAAATALQNDGGQQADVTLLRSLSTQVSSTFKIDATKVVPLTSGDASVLATRINALDLVAVSGFLANGTNLLDLPVLWNVPQFSSGATSLQVIEGPQRGCGTVGVATADTAQVTMSALPKLNVPTIAGLSATSTPVNLAVTLASAHGLLTSVTCGAGTSASPIAEGVRVSRSLSSMNLDIPIHLTGTMKASAILLGSTLTNTLLSLGLGLNAQASVDLTIQAGSSVSSTTLGTDASYAVPPHSWSDPEHVGGSGGWLLPHVSIDAADVTGTITVGTTVLNVANLRLGTDYTITPITDDLVSKNVIPGINGFIDNVNAQLTPLTQLLGLQVAGADLFGVATPSCHTPALRG